MFSEIQCQVCGELSEEHYAMNDVEYCGKCFEEMLRSNIMRILAELKVYDDQYFKLTGKRTR